MSLIKTGSTTHSNNMDQRFIELPFTASGATLDLHAAVESGALPPGYYMLFVLDGAGVPSTAKIVRVAIAVTQHPPSDFTAAIGGAGGGPFQLACEAGEVLVGVRGTTATYVQQVAPQCVKVNQSGQWIGSPVERGITGAAGATAYLKMCAANQAISGFRGRSSQYVNQLDFECRTLTSNGKLTGTGTFLGAVGPATGTAQGPYRCESEQSRRSRSTAVRAAGWTTSACSAVRRPRRSSTRRRASRTPAASRARSARTSICRPRRPMRTATR